MARRRTILESRWPTTAPFQTLAGEWCEDASTRLLALVWKGWDLLIAEVLVQVDIHQSDRQLERSVAQLLEPRIRRAMTGDEPFDAQHEVYEYETAKGNERPPQYDIAFVLRENPRIMWPMEAKVLRTDRAVAAYVSDVRDQFLTCRYAPFSAGGAMLACLVTGSPTVAFAAIASALHCNLSHHAAFPARPHKTSRHNRAVPTGKRYLRRFGCHHLLLRLS